MNYFFTKSTLEDFVRWCVYNYQTSTISTIDYIYIFKEDTERETQRVDNGIPPSQITEKM